MKPSDYVDQALSHGRTLLSRCRTKSDIFEVMEVFEDEIKSLYDQGLIKRKHALNALVTFSNDCFLAPVE